MKKNLFCLISLFVVLAFGFVHAQAQFEMGAQVAANASNYISQSVTKAGFEAGLFFRVGRSFFFEPEINYVFRNSYVESNENENVQAQQLKQHFVDVPLLLGYHFVDNRNFKFYLFIGPRVGFRIADNWHDQQTEFGHVQWGGQLGLGLDFWRFTLNGRYDISGSKFKTFGDGTHDFWKQNMWVVTLGFKIVRR